MNLQIERGVPLPPARHTGPVGISAAIKLLQPGESVVLPRSVQGLNCQLQHYRRKGLRLTARTVDANSCRVWRLPDAEVSA